MVEELRRTPLFTEHQNLGARFVGFGGWQMPVSYSSLNEEHQTVRTRVGLFDVSHMGEIFVRGPRALSFLQFVCSNDVEKAVQGKAQYSLLLNDSGGVVDDIIVYCLGKDEYLLCVNAANSSKDFAWLKAHQMPGAELENASDDFGQIAVQGPFAAVLLSAVCGGAAFDAQRFPSFSFAKMEILGGSRRIPVICARTGYTGEDGFELFVPAAEAVSVWRKLLEAGSQFGVKPIGLGARDTLRLEASLPLYGHELRDDICALSANVAWAVKLDKPEFVGRASLAAEKVRGISRRLSGLAIVDAGIAREGAKVFCADGKECGFVTSGTKTPSLARAVAMAYLDRSGKRTDSGVEVDVRGRRLKAEVVKMPFYRRAAGV